MTAPKLTGGRCQCPSCFLLFTSEREFNRHRIGDYAEPGAWEGSRRCLTWAELVAAGWRSNERGFLMQARPKRAPAGISGPRVTPTATWVQAVMP